MPTLRHSPEAVEVVTIDWSSRANRDQGALVLASGETVTASSWTVPAGLTGTADSFDDDSSEITISGGTAGQTYALRCEVTTSLGRTIEQTTHVEVERT